MDQRIERLRQLIEVVDRLRGPGGCPWDREQTHLSLRSTLLEEAYEVLETIDEGSMARLEEELGDLLLQVLMQATIAHDEAAFDLGDVAERVREKLVRRHPHVFGDVEVSGASEALTRWCATGRR